MHETLKLAQRLNCSENLIHSYKRYATPGDSPSHSQGILRLGNTIFFNVLSFFVVSKEIYYLSCMFILQLFLSLKIKYFKCLLKISTQTQEGHRRYSTNNLLTGTTLFTLGSCL